MRFLWLVLAPVLLLGLLGCTRKETDAARLQKKIDTFKVHIYVGAKATLAEAGGDAKVKRLRETLVKVIVSKDANVLAEEVSGASLAALAKQVWRLRERGAKLVREGGDHPPILPVLTGGRETLQSGGAGGRSIQIDANTEHCLLMAALLTAKFHGRAPVPVPDELILYEASRCEPARVTEAAAPLHAVRAYAFARGELCDLASKETDAVFAVPDHEGQFRGVLTFLTRGVVGEKQSQTFSAGLESLAHGAVAVCYLKRGERDRMHEPLGKMLDSAEKGGLKTAESSFLRAYLECSRGNKEAKQGTARLEKLGKRADLPSYLRGDVEHLAEYCKTSAGTSSDLLRKIALSRLAMRLVMQHAEQAGAIAVMEKDSAYRSIRRLGAVSAVLAKLKDGKGLKDSAKGLLKRLRE